MAMTYQNFASLGVNLNRQKYGPLDISNVFTSAADLKYYLTKGTFTTGVSEYWYKNANEKVVPYPYEGQVLATAIDGEVKVYVLRLDAQGAFEAKAIEPEVDGTTIKLTNGKLELVGLPTDTAGKTYVPSYVNGVLTWAEPDTSTAEGQAQEIEGLKTRAKALEDTVNGTAEAEGLVAKVAALEAVDNATQDELDAYKAEVTTAIGEALQAAKDYADQNDADTKYDDTALAGRVSAIEADYLKEADKYDDTALAARVKAIEDDYLKEADKYDDTALAGRVTTAEGKIADLEAAVEAIDFVDEDELAEAIKDFATDSELADGLALKADKTALEDLKATVDAFLTGDGTEAALDSLKELIAYIDSHDDVDIAGIIEDIEAIEGKLAGVETTVVAYVTAAIDALKIGDYAKAADLTALAGRVEALEAKPFDTYATKTEVSDVDAKFADYTKTSDLDTALAAKADAGKVVSNDTFETFKSENTAAIEAAQSAAVAAAKTETETQVGALEDAVAETYATKEELTEAVEGIENELTAYAKTADVNAELAKKIETGTITHTTEETAEGVTVSGTQMNIVVDAFTKAETRQYVADTISQMTGGESAADVLLALNNYKSDNDERVGAIETKNGEQDTAIAKAQSDATKGIEDAAKVATDLAALDARVVSNTNEIGVVKGTITTVNETLSGKVTALENKDTEIAGLISGLDTTVKGHTTTITEQGNKITALENEDVRLATLIQGNTDKFAGYYTKGEVDTKVQEAIDAIPEVDFDPYATIAYVDGELAKKANASAVYTKDEADAEFMTQDEVDARINALIVAADPEGGKTITDIQNLVKYVDENAGEIATLITATQANTEKLAGITTTVTAHVASAIETAIAGVVQPKASEEVTVAADGTLGLGKVSTDKLEMGTDTLVIDGGSAAK